MKYTEICFLCLFCCQELPEFKGYVCFITDWFTATELLPLVLLNTWILKYIWKINLLEVLKKTILGKDKYRTLSVQFNYSTIHTHIHSWEYKLCSLCGKWYCNSLPKSEVHMTDSVFSTNRHLSYRMLTYTCKEIQEDIQCYFIYKAKDWKLKVSLNKEQAKHIIFYLVC